MSITLDKTEDSNTAQGSTETNIEIELKEYKTRLDLLYDVAQQASSVSEVSNLLKEIPCVIQRILNASASSLFMIDEEKREFCLRAATGEKSDMLSQIRLGLDTGIIGWVARNGVPVVVNDVSQDRRFNKDVDEATGFVTESIMAAPLARGQKVIGVLEMVNKADGSAFDDKDLGLITEFTSMEALILLVSMAATLINNFKMCQSVQDEYKSTIETLVTAADAKDPYAHGHSRRVKEYALLAANSLRFSPEELKFIEFGALLHDIGKIGIDDRILRKSGPLTNEEWYIIRKHALKGANIVGDIPNLEKATDIILYHHEKYDGTGYPEGLKGEQIPIGARLVAVADAFDTMTTDHSYRAALSVDEAIRELVKGIGTQFCPVAVQAFTSGFQKHRGTLSMKEAVPAAKEEAKIEAEEARKAKEAEKLAMEEATQAVKEDAEREAEETGKVEEAVELAMKEMAQPVREEAKGEAEETGKVEEAVKLAMKEAVQAVKEEAKREAEETRKAKEAEKLAKKEAVRAAKGEAKREAEEARKAKEAEKLAKKEAARAAKEEAKRKAEETRKAGKANHDTSPEHDKGDVQLTIRSFVSHEQINQFRKCLRTVENLRIVLDSWSEKEGIKIVVSVQEPLALDNILRQMPPVKELYREGKNIVVVLNNSNGTE